MNWKRTVLFLAVLILLAGLYYWKVYRPQAADRIFSLSQDPAQIGALTLNPKETIDHLIIQDASKGTEISFLKLKNQSWRMTRPMDGPAESLILEGFVTLLKLTKRTRSLSFEGLSENEFGFKSPRLVICVSTDQRKKERCLLIGADAAIANGAYAKWRDESKYFLVDRNFISAFDKTLYALRKKQIFTLLEQPIKSIRFRSSNREFEIGRDGKHWALVKPVRAVLGDEAANQLLSQLNGLYVKEFLDHERFEDSRLALNPGLRMIEVIFEDGSGQRLIQGAEALGRDAYYTRVKDEPSVLLVSLEKLNKIEKAFHALVS